MKKLILLMTILLLSFSSFSQQDTQPKRDSIVALQVPIARLVIKDLIRGDGAQEEIKLLNESIDQLKLKLDIQQALLANEQEKSRVYQEIIEVKDQQLKVSKELSEGLTKDLRKEKTKSFFYKIGTGVAGVTVVLLLLK